MQGSLSRRVGLEWQWLWVIVLFGDPREWSEPWLINRMERIAAEKIWMDLGSCNDEAVLDELTRKCEEVGLNPVECIRLHGDPREWS